MSILTEVEEELSKEKELLGDGVSPEGKCTCMHAAATRGLTLACV